MSEAATFLAIIGFFIGVAGLMLIAVALLLRKLGR